MNLPATALTAGTDGALIIANAPCIPGLHFRAYRDEADLAAMVEVRNASMAANGENETWSLASLAHELANLTTIEPRQDYVLALVEDRLIAFSEIEWADDPDGQRHYRSAGFVLPRWRRRGIGVAMLTRNEDRLREIAATHDLEKPAVLLSLLAELDSGGLALFRSRGYRRVRTYHH
ncbi:MAG: N-acetyltransferase family protein, partial [Chloroflexota bacterium]